MKHKNAEDLQIRDKFAMAGGHYEIVDIIEIDDPDKIKIAFVPLWLLSSSKRCYMILDRSILFTVGI